MQGHVHAPKVTVQGHAHAPQGHGARSRARPQGHGARSRAHPQSHGARSRAHPQSHGARSWCKVTAQCHAAGHAPKVTLPASGGGGGHTGIRGPHIFSMGLESMGNNNNSGGSTMMIVLVVCACCCCVSSLIPVVAYFAYPPFKTWLNGLFGMNPVGGTWTCRANWQGISAGHTLGSPNPNGGIIKNAQTGGNITTNWGGQSDATWACNAWNSPCGNSPGKCSAFAA